ncbi:MAG: hypothetical protein K8R58_13700 [Bacteroidales bacterium]|nr:hypothetical protein [Bacteroidales bacterium]
MKKAIKILVIAAFLMVTPLFIIAQNPPHPNGGSGPGTGNTPVGGGAPIDGGLSIMLVLGAAYGSKKLYKAFK